MGSLYILPFLYMYIFIPQINTSAISNMLTEPQIRVTVRFSLPNLPGHVALA
jgi:hypothetical protein